MPAQSKQQQMAAGAALSAKKGERKVSSLRGASKQMYESMSKRQLEDIAGTKRKPLPKKKSGGSAKKSSGGSKNSSAKSKGRSQK